MKDEKQAEDFLRAKGLTGDFKTKRILTPEQGTLVEWFVEFANQQPEVDYQKMFSNCKLPNEHGSLPDYWTELE